MTRADLTTGDINAHILRLTIPASVGWFFNTMFNVVDTFFAGKISTTALAGMSMSFPIFFMVIAFCSGLGTGSTALISNALGRKSPEDAHRLGLNALVLGAGLGLTLTLVGLLSGEALFKAMGAEGEALGYGLSYINLIFFGATFFVMNHILNAMLVSQGDTRSNRNFLIAAFTLNIFLDPLFIFGWFGLPEMGTAGVALATILVQIMGTVFLTYKVIRSPAFNREILRGTRVSLRTCFEVLKQGLPASFNMMATSLGVFIINAYAMRYGGDTSVAAYGASLRIEQLALLPALGLNMATLTIAGQNYGARRLDRVKEVYRHCLRYGFMVMTTGMLLIFPLARVLVSVFAKSPEVVNAGVGYLRISIFAFNAYMLINISLSVMQAVKRPNIAMFIGFYRQVVLPAGIFYLLGTTFGLGVKGVWYGIVLINWSAVAIVLLYTRSVLHKLTEKQAQEQA
jgi:putative MATE family efflux protein